MPYPVDPLYPRPDAPASPGSDVLGEVRPPATTLPASRVPRPSLPRLDNAPGDGASACPVCGSEPSPARMPRRIPRWLQRAREVSRWRSFGLGTGFAP
jgi:hypothetical protein